MCLKCCLLFVGALFAFLTLKMVTEPSTPNNDESKLTRAVRTIISAAGSDRSTFEKLFRDAGAGALVEAAHNARSGQATSTGGAHLTGIDAPFDYLADERATYGYVNYESQRMNENLLFRRLPCANNAATTENRKGVDALTDFVEEGYKVLGCPTGPRCLDLPSMSTAKRHFIDALGADPKCTSALLNAATVIALQNEQVEEDEIDKYVQPLVKDNNVHLAVRAKAWLMRGVAMERLGRSAAHEYDMVRRLWPRFCIPYSAFKCNSRFFPWRLLSDPSARTEAGRTAEKQAVLRVLLAAEYQTVHLGMMSNTTQEESKAFPTRHYIVIKNIMSGYALAMHQYEWLTLINTNSIPFGDPQVRTRYGHANDAVSNMMRGMLNDVVQMVMGRPIKPTYSYFGGYREGSVLSPHTDRLACEFTMSVMLYSEPAEPWAFLIDSRALTVAPAERGGAHPRPDQEHLVNITLYNGDAGLIRGRRVIHFRDEYKGKLLLQQFHHYVFDDFSEDNYGK